MKKTFFLFFSLATFLQAAPNGNPADPAIIEEGFIIPDTCFANFKVAYIYYNVSDLIMEFQDPYKNDGYNVRKIEAFSNLASMIIDFKERLDIYFNIGSYRLESEFRKNSNLYKSKSENDIFYQTGAKLALFEIMDFTIGIDAKYSLFFAPSAYFTLNDKVVNENNLQYNFKEWQIGVGIAQKIAILRPYIGVAYKDTQLKLSNINSLEYSTLRLLHKKNAGVFLGASASTGSFVLANIEARFVNERSIALTLELRF